MDTRSVNEILSLEQEKEQLSFYCVVLPVRIGIDVFSPIYFDVSPCTEKQNAG